jgi:hypothetical protein
METEKRILMTSKNYATALWTIIFLFILSLLAPAAVLAQAEAPEKAPAKAQATAPGDIKVDLTQIFSNVAYSNGERADTNFTILTMNFPNRNQVWYGFYKMAWNARPSAPSPPYFEEYYTLGGKFYDRDRAWYQLDYFRMTNSNNRITETLGGEYCYHFGKSLWGGAGYYSSNFFEKYKMTEYTLRLLYYATPRLSFNTKLYFTETSENRKGTALQEKVDFALTNNVAIQVRGATGKRIHALDNDGSSFYSQYEDLQSSLGAQVSWGMNSQLALFAGFSKDNFDAYSQKITFGGLNIKF